VNISTDGFDYGSSGTTGVWSNDASAAANFAPSLLGFTYRGFVPSSLYASVPDAPGLVVEFPSQDLVFVTGNFRFFELLVKLPSCSVATLATGAEFVGAAGNALVPVDSRIENVECSNRGQCNRASGLCECFSGFCASPPALARAAAARSQPPAHPTPPHLPPSQTAFRARR
jgi:hypothetical protein